MSRIRDLSFPKYEEAVEDALSGERRVSARDLTEDQRLSILRGFEGGRDPRRVAALMPLSAGKPAMPPGTTSEEELTLFDNVRPGDKVTIVNRFGQISTGRAVMRGPAGWVLNMGGRHGTPAIATLDNITAVRIPKGKR